MKAIGFDLGNTLISYENFPLNWQSFYADALRKVLEVPALIMVRRKHFDHWRNY